MLGVILLPRYLSKHLSVRDGRPMTHLQTLYSVRKNLVPQRQPRIQPEMEGLHTALGLLTPPGDHPFELNAVQYQEISKIPLFKAQPVGHECTIGDRFLYRLAPLGDLMRWAGWDLLSRGDPDWSMHRKLRDDTAGARWQPLSTYCSGDVAGRRGFSWWSILDLFISDHARAASRAGVALDRLPPYGAVLRLRINDLAPSNPPRVPTAIDAWDQSIFDPTYDAPVPTSGITISLENPTSLGQGCDEYVLGPLPAAAIDFIAVQDTLVTGFGMRADDTLWQRLAVYY